MGATKKEFLKYRNELYGNYSSYRELNYQPQQKGYKLKTEKPYEQK